MKRVIKLLVCTMIVMMILIGDTNNSFSTSNKNVLVEATIYYENISKAESEFIRFITACLTETYEEYIDIITPSNTFDTALIKGLTNAVVIKNTVYKTSDGFVGIYLFRFQNGDHYTIKCLMDVETQKIIAVDLLYNGVGV